MAMCSGLVLFVDPKTKEFLSKNIDRVFGFPKIVRYSWSTASKLLEERAAAVHW